MALYTSISCSKKKNPERDEFTNDVTFIIIHWFLFIKYMSFFLKKNPYDITEWNTYLYKKKDIE